MTPQGPERERQMNEAENRVYEILTRQDSPIGRPAYDASGDQWAKDRAAEIVAALAADRKED
jgi:hypothetical protein